MPRQPSIIIDACVVENNVITVAWEGHVTGPHDNAYVLELDDGSGGEFRASLLNVYYLQ